MQKPDKNQRYTVDDFLILETEERYELVEGYPVFMSPASFDHEGVVANLITEIGSALKGSSCQVVGSNLAIVPYGDQRNDWDKEKFYLPDVSVICDRSKLRDGKYYGAPDLVVEVLSPSTSRKDVITKFRDYEKAGVKEYWIVDHLNKYIKKFVLTNERLLMEDAYDLNMEFGSTVLPQIKFYVSDIFRFLTE